MQLQIKGGSLEVLKYFISEKKTITLHVQVILWEHHFITLVMKIILVWSNEQQVDPVSEREWNLHYTGVVQLVILTSLHF